jgi:hypothetical protein
MPPQQKASSRLARVSAHLVEAAAAAPASPHPSLLAAAPSSSSSTGSAGLLRVASFEFDVTPPLGTPLMDGGVAAAAEIKTPLTARGVVLLGMIDGPAVLCSVDWVSICNDSHDRLRAALARGCGTTLDRVALHTVHQHDAPGCDSATEHLLEAHGLGGLGMVEPFLPNVAAEFEAATRAAVAGGGTPVTHIGTGSAVVDRVASNRHIMGAARTRSVPHLQQQCLEESASLLPALAAATKLSPVRPALRQAHRFSDLPWLYFSFWVGGGSLAAADGRRSDAEMRTCSTCGLRLRAPRTSVCGSRSRTGSRTPDAATRRREPLGISIVG